MDTPAKQKVTVTLPAEIVRALDAQARKAGGSRSAALARVLDEWQRQAAPLPGQSTQTPTGDAARLDADTAAFYAAQSDDDRDDDSAWAALASHAAIAAWDTP